MRKTRIGALLAVAVAVLMSSCATPQEGTLAVDMSVVLTADFDMACRGTGPNSGIATGAPIEVFDTRQQLVASLAAPAPEPSNEGAACEYSWVVTAPKRSVLDVVTFGGVRVSDRFGHGFYFQTR